MGDAIALTVLGLAVVGLGTLSVLFWKALGMIGALLDARAKHKGEAAPLLTDNPFGTGKEEA
jgi:hypothetical protein